MLRTSANKYIFLNLLSGFQYKSFMWPVPHVTHDLILSLGCLWCINCPTCSARAEVCVSHDTAQDCPTTWQRSSHCAQSSVGCQKPIRLKDFSSSHDQQNLTREDEKVCRYCHKFKRHYRGWAIDFRERKSPRMEFHIVSITTWRSMWLSTLACMTGALWAKRGERDISRFVLVSRSARNIAFAPHGL